MKDELGDRMKLFETVESGRKLMPMLPVLARIDGRAFHSFTKGMNRPFDEGFSSSMIETTKELVKKTNACMGYTQSDEITLAWYSNNLKSQIWFDGRVSKMTSQLAAQATLIFYQNVLIRMPQYAERMPTFDARVWNVPNCEEGANVFLWREWDATKNSISMAASDYFSHKQLCGKNSKIKLDMLLEAGVNWNEYPTFFKRGSYIQRKLASKKFSTEELAKLPKEHKAHENPNLLVDRHVYEVINMPIFSTVSNRKEVIFEGATPLEFKTS